MIIKQTIQDYWEDLPIEFYSLNLIKYVRLVCDRPKIFDGSILRKMRELKQDGRIDFECVDHARSKYRRIPIFKRNFRFEKNGQLAFY